MPFLSICIPAYNRAEFLPPLMDSLLHQENADFEVLIAEDHSPQRPAIRAVVDRYRADFGERVRYMENQNNLGYDGNLRALIANARGDYVLFMGNDDLMCPGAMAVVEAALKRHSNIGVLIRAYADFDISPEHPNQYFRYFPDECFFPAGISAVVTAFRRSVVISGMVVHRESALAFATDRFDGTLLYQQWLVANILLERNAVYLPDILVLRRNGIPPDFGQAKAEQGRFVPRDQTPESSLHFMEGMLRIAKAVEIERYAKIFKPILADLANYSYPILAIQAGRSFRVFLQYCRSLGRMGFGRHPLFYAYFFGLVMLGRDRMDWLIKTIKNRLGRTPVLGRISHGQSR